MDKMEAHTRVNIIYEFARLLKENREALAQLESIDSGKPYEVALVMILMEQFNNLNIIFGFATKINGKTTQISNDLVSYTVHEPIGVVGQIIPWNFPLLMAAWKLGAALAVGCTIVIKPATETPLSLLYRRSYLRKQVFLTVS